MCNNPSHQPQYQQWATCGTLKDNTNPSYYNRQLRFLSISIAPAPSLPPSRTSIPYSEATSYRRSLKACFSISFKVSSCHCSILRSKATSCHLFRYCLNPLTSYYSQLTIRCLDNLPTPSSTSLPTYFEFFYHFYSSHRSRNLPNRLTRPSYSKSSP